MSPTRRLLLALLVCVSSFSPGARAQDKDLQALEPAIRKVTQQYFEALASRNADLVMSFWNVESPDFKSHRRKLDQLFASTGSIEVRDLYVGRISWGIWNIGTAIVRVSLDLKTADPRTGMVLPGSGSWDKTVRLAYEGGSWNVWSELDSKDDVDSLDLFEAQLRDARAKGDRTATANALIAIGQKYRAQGDSARAMGYFNDSLPAGGSRAFTSIATLFANQGDDPQALSYYGKALDALPAEGHGDERAAALCGMADVYQSQGHASQALELYEKALILAQSGGYQAQTSVVLRGIGRHYFDEHNYTQALDFYSRALSLEDEVRTTQAQLPELLLDIAKVHLADGREQEGLSFLGRAHDAAARSDYLNNMWEMRYVLGQFRRSHAESYTERARTDPNYARTRAIELEKARNEFDVAIETVEATRLQVAGEEQRQRFMEGRVLPYNAMIELLLDSGDLPTALDYAERSKGRVLLDLFQPGQIDLSQSMTDAQRLDQQRLNSQLVSLNTAIAQERQQLRPDEPRLKRLHADLDQTRLDREAFQTNLSAAHPAADTELRIAKTIGLDDTSALMGDDATALLEYVVVRDRTFLFVVTTDSGASHAHPSLKVYPIDVSQEALAKRVEQYHDEIANHDLGFRADGRALYDLLLGPAQSDLRGKTSIVVVPDGILWDLPFQALLSPAEHFVIEDLAISYAPSLTVLTEFSKVAGNRRPNGAATTLLAFGNPTVAKQTAQRVKPVFMDESLEPLPQAGRQVRALGALYGTGQSQVYVGAAAREDRVKTEASGARILQFATHGILNSASPLYSNLVLSQRPGAASSPDRNEDGLLEAWEIMNLKLNADVVVLAACETARGRVGAGEGMIGMAWAFLVAGAPTTVASQWKVESASTTDLMLEFHRNLKARIDRGDARLATAKAMQLAAQKLLKQKLHPFYWAGFVVIGDGR